MAASDVTSSAERRLIDVTDVEPTMAETSSEDREPEERPAKQDRSPKAKRGGNKISDFVRANPRLVASIALLVVGIIFVILGWYGAAYTNILTEQIPYLISGGLLGAALIIVAGFLASSASLERENRELRRDLVRAIGSMPARGSNSGVNTLSAAPSSDGQVFVVAGGRSFHVAGCPLVEGKDATPMEERKAIDSGYASCKLCGTD
jgi:hypothetical protein